MVSAVLLATLLTGSARADDGAVYPAGDFRIQRHGAPVDITRVVEPKPALTETTERHCRVSVRMGDEGAIDVQVLPSCPQKLVSPSTSAMDGWTITVTDPPATGAELFEVWFRYPTETGDPSSVWIRQAFDADLRMVGGVVGALEVAPMAIAPPTLSGDLVPEDVVCEAKVEVSPIGGMVSESVITGCDEPYADAVRAAMKDWRFKAPAIDANPAKVGVTMGVRFDTIAGATPGETEIVASVEMPQGVDRGSGAQPKAYRARPKGQGGPPKGEPLLLVDHDPFAEVGVYEVVWPEVTPADEVRRCDLLWQVDSRRHVIIWPEDCDTTVEQASLDAAHQWTLMHGTIERGERYARFYASFVYDAGAMAPRLSVPKKDLITLDKSLKDQVSTYREASVVMRVPPKPPADAGPAVCEISLTVATSGKPKDISVDGCEGAHAASAEKAIGKWRWDAAEEDGRPLETRVKVRLKFG